MIGNGYFNVYIGGYNFVFQNLMNIQEFIGMLVLFDIFFDLSDDNIIVLILVLVFVGVGSVIIVGIGIQVINGFLFDGGVVNFGVVIQGVQ